MAIVASPRAAPARSHLPRGRFPYRFLASSRIAGKWKLPIICSLAADGASRYNELLKRVRGISNTMLSQTLKEMEADQLVKRAEYLEVPVRVEY